MINALQRLGQSGLAFLGRVGVSFHFLVRTLTTRVKWDQAWSLFAQQLYRIGIFSLPIIVVSGVFIGMVVALQGYNTLEKFGADQELGQLLALSVVRELGPVVSALLFAGRAGSSLTAELGLMRATRQIDSLEMMAVDPFWRIVSPRLWGGFVALPLLAILFNVAAIYGGYLIGVMWLGVDGGAFWANMQAAVDFHADVMNGVYKTIVFGGVITWIAIFQGYYAAPNAYGISKATTKTVVYASLMTLGLDFVLTALMMGGW